MGRPVQADGRQTRQAILDAALDLFAERGYFGTSLRDIAAVVGVRESAFYNYFDSKEALFSELLEASRQSKDEEWARFLAEPQTDVRSTLERLTTIILGYFCDPRQERIFRISMSDGIRLARQGRFDAVEQMTHAAKPFHELMRQLIDVSDLRSGNPELLAMEFLGPLLLWRNLRAAGTETPLGEDHAGFAREHVEQFLRGAAAGTSGGGRSVKRTSTSSRRTGELVRGRRRGNLKLVR
jgi:AcrR family transcriptional regulator